MFFTFFISTLLLGTSVGEQLMAQVIVQKKLSSALSITKSQPLVIVYCYTDRCIYCRHTKPLIEQLKQIYGSRISFVELNVSDNMPAFKHNFNASTVPLIMYFKNGNEVARHGSDNKTITLARMQSIIESQLLS